MVLPLGFCCCYIKSAQMCNAEGKKGFEDDSSTPCVGFLEFFFLFFFLLFQHVLPPRLIGIVQVQQHGRVLR